MSVRRPQHRVPDNLRSRKESGESYGSSALELFFDLVYVFAITQISHLLLSHLTWEGAGQSALVLLTVWWAWQFTTWLTNELDPDSIPVRLLLMAVALASLLMSIAIPEAFGDRSLLFAGAYVAIQVGRQGFLTFYAAGPGTTERRRAFNIFVWFCGSGIFWIAGGLSDGTTRAVLWIVALAIDYGGPLATFRIPGRFVERGAWELGTAHFAERFGLFVIIALGESIVVTGSTTSGLELDASTVAALCTAFVGAAALWWLYFNTVAGLSERALEESEDTILEARDTYTYGHALIIAGIVISAVGDEIIIAHPTEHLHTPELLATVGGAFVYLLAQFLIRLRHGSGISVRRLSGMGVCVLLAIVGTGLSALTVGIALDVMLIGLIFADHIRAAQRAREAAAAS